MNTIDGTSREERTAEAPPPSLLVIVLDTNPHAWALLADTLPLLRAVQNLLVFINAHLAINHANQIAVIASHTQSAIWLYPTPRPAESSGPVTNSHASDTSRPDRSNGSAGLDGGDAMDTTDDAGSEPVPPVLDDANKYRPFALIEHALLTNLRALLDHTTPATLRAATNTMMAGALTLALTYISKAAQSASATPSSVALADSTNPSDTANNSGGGGGGGDTTNGGEASTTRATLHSRILILSTSGDLASQYIPVMNAVFACQRLRIPVDVLKLAGDAVFLQQAADATGGVYLAPPDTLHAHGLLQYLMLACLPDQSSRAALVLPGPEEVDFRAACFCHRRVVDVGYVCSICLSIFCDESLGPGGLGGDAGAAGGVGAGEGRAMATCLTCGTQLVMRDFGAKPVVVATAKAPKKKRKRAVDGGVSTPGGGETPGPS
ncbi:hypothetical protein B0A49_00505 [Cryomyces minteri]|uniref:General transcription and DNA repair factor IIH subunit TFB4 n=1 Tax=Cryomyces minteri TaxID=331657 RepID=A0A4U0XXU3_9PEZI|nr:hypothetical protein B0A49_00505 [Cryomyces minteri]